MTLIWLILLPFVGSVVAALLPANARNAEAWLSGFVTVSGLVMTALLFPDVNGGGVVRQEYAWMSSIGVDFVLRVDGFAWMFALMVNGIGALVVIYARYYMSPEDPVPRFFSFLLAFTGAMLGVVLAGNLIQLVFFWELTSLFSFLLIGYWHHLLTARDGARMALIVTGTGGLCLLAGVLLLGAITGSYDVDTVLASGDVIREHRLYVPALVLVLVGVFTKSAQFPFHFWLPQAMAAPTPVSAFLHSATMVKAGVFLLARLWPVLAGTDTWAWLVGTVGLVTLLFGAWSAIFQQDLKGLLAYSTISHLGLITLLLGLNRPVAAVAGIFHIMNHATFKASLFMAAGVIDHETGTRDIRRLSGLFRSMPETSTLALVATAAMAGVPLLNGFLSKEMFFAETLGHGDNLFEQALPYLATLASVFSVGYSVRFIADVFFGPPPTDLPSTPHEPPRWMRFPIEVLVFVCLIVGVIPSIVVRPILDTAAAAVLGPDMPAYSLALWHGFTLPVLMSIIAMVGGVVLYIALRRYLARGAEGAPLLRRWQGKRVFERTLVAIAWRASRLEAFLGTRRLQPQLQVLFFVTILAALVPLWRSALLSGSTIATDPSVPFALLWLVGAVCAVGSAYVAKFHRFAALLLMSVAGVLVCLTFVWLSAPDLALTQLLVEIVTTVLLLLGLRWLPAQFPHVPKAVAPSPHLRHLRDLALAISAGAGLALTAYVIMTRPLEDSVARAFVEKSYSEGGGRNVVNVILVDFRGFDTMGEITVLGVVALTVYALLRRFRPAPDSIARPQQQALQQAKARRPGGGGDPLENLMYVTGLIMHWVFPFIGALGAYLFLRGHDRPGGGFAAGIAVSIAFILQYMATSTRWVEDRLRIRPVQWMGTGLLYAVLTGAAAWLFGLPFLTSGFRYVTVPLIGEVPFATALFFDLGVFLLVVGSTTLILTALAHQSLRSRRTAGAPVEPKKEAAT